MSGAARVFTEMVKRPPPVAVETRIPFSFIHINKCAGTSVEIALGLRKAHTTALAMREQLGAGEWAERLSFTFVRNPFARVVSIYYYRLRTDQTGLGDRHLSFNRWVAKVWGEGDAHYIKLPYLVAPALAWLTDETGRVIVSEIGRTETMAEDWARIAGRLGVAPVLPRINTSMAPPYRALYSAEARALVEEAFRPDLESFGYAY